MKRIPLILMTLALGMFAISCAGGEQGGEHAGNGHDQEEALAEGDGENEEDDGVEVNEAGGWGEVITAEGAMSVDAMVAAMGATEAFRGKVKGEIVSCCQNSGCWMKVAYGDGEEMRIAFKDYGFFVPKDLAGTEVIFEGVASKTEISVETLKHFAEDEGLPQEKIDAITEPEFGLEFEAIGVLPVGT